jgi:hypothetical protein
MESEAPMNSTKENSFDIFVSYAAIDDQHDRWVTKLIDGLWRHLLIRQGSNELRIFMDRQISPDEDRACEAARNSILFLAIVSPGYIADIRVKRELTAFVAANKDGGRIFLIERLPTERSDWPPELQDLICYRFWQRDRDHFTRTRTLTLELDEAAYLRNVDDLASDIHDRIEEVKTTPNPRTVSKPQAIASPMVNRVQETPASDNKFDVFVSYAHQNKPTADAACAMIEAEHIRCWIAPRDIVPGMDWGEAIIDAIAGAKIMVLIFSSHANASPQIKREVERAVNRSMPIITVRIEDAPLSKSLQYFLSAPHWLDAMTPPIELHLKRLVGAVKALLSSQA